MKDRIEDAVWSDLDFKFDFEIEFEWLSKAGRKKKFRRWKKKIESIFSR